MPEGKADTDTELDRKFNEWIAQIESENDATRRSEILTAADYEITINAR